VTKVPGIVLQPVQIDGRIELQQLGFFDDLSKMGDDLSKGLNKMGDSMFGGMAKWMNTDGVKAVTDV